jgi:glycosyltransferase involved in cell wall biosynthesis
MKIACFKFVGLATGGTEKYLQTVACLLAKEHDVDFYYTNNAPLIDNGFKHPDNSDERKRFVESRGVTTIPIHIDSVNTTTKTWNGSNIWDVFDPSKYDAVQSARYGLPEFPFTEIRGTKLIDSIHGDLSDSVSQVHTSVLISKWQADKWIKSGGNPSKMVVIPTLVYVPDKIPSTFRQKLGIPADAFVYGFHQRNDDGIFSPVSLAAYAHLQDENTYFILLGGSQRHRQLAKELNLKNVVFVDFAAKVEDIHDFLGALDVYAHARSDGEVCSAAIIEAMYNGLPVITHPAQNMGHSEQIDGCGKMAWSMEEYVDEMRRLKNEKSYLSDKKAATIGVYSERYCYKKLEEQYLDIYRNLNR